MKRLAKIALGFALAVSLLGCGITAGGLKDDPGYADFVRPHFWEADEEMHISLGPSIIALGRMFIHEEEELSGLVSSVRGINLHVYDVEENQDVLNNYLQDSTTVLIDAGWQVIVTSQEEDQNVAILVKLIEEEIQGLVVLSVEPREAVFVNIIGNIQPEDVQPLLAQVQDKPKNITTTL